jgi:hypothetical protein
MTNSDPPYQATTSFIFDDDIKNLLSDIDFDDQFTSNVTTPNETQTILDESKPNEPYGDTHLQKNPEHDRWYLQNVNGINTEMQWLDWKEKLKFLQEAKVDCFNFTETNLRWTPEQIQMASRLGRKWFKQFSLTTSSSNDPTTRKAYQPGGTCTGITNNLVGRLTTKGSDPSGLGRWSYVCLEGKISDPQNPENQVHSKTYSITAYCPSQPDSSTPGPDTAFMQQKRLLTLQGVEQPRPRQQFFEDLAQQVIEWQSTKATVLLSMDANADLMDKDFQKFITMTGLIDLMAYKLGTGLPETYNRGTKTIDHNLGSPILAHALEHAGYLAYNDGIVTDHRGMILDFNRAKLFGALQELAQRPERTLHTKNKLGARQYREQASDKIISNHILRRAIEIENASQTEFPPELQAELETLDSELHHILLEAEKQIATHVYIPWSPELHKAHEIWKYWRIRLSNLKNKRRPGKRSTEILEKLRSQYEVDQGDQARTISSQLRKARTHLLHCRQSSVTLRQAHLDQIALKYELEDNVKKAKIVKRIMRAEAQAAMYKVLRKYLRPAAQSLTYVEVPEIPYQDPKTATKWKKVFDKTELERILQERNRQHFSQAATDCTPFTIDPLAELLHFRADTEFSEKFRSGQIDLTELDLDDDVYALLEELLPKTDDPTKISEDIPVEEVIAGFKKWNENTSTGGRHLGHYKCWLMKRSDNEKSLSETEFFTILTTIYRICVKNRYPLKRWQQCSNLFIPKDPGSHKLHRLRVIHIVDTCLNFLRRFYIARRLLHHVQDNRLLADEQWGGIPGRTAIDLVMSKEMMLSTLHLLKRNGALTDVDATACYDRIIPCIMWLSYFKAGATWNLVQLFATALRNLTYYIVTAFGKSDRFNKHFPWSQFLGPGQGATDSPFAWALISSFLIFVYNKRAHGCHFEDPTGEFSWKRAIDMFVDDAYLYHLIALGLGASALMAIITHDISSWSKILWTSGGAVNYQKSFYSMLIWKFNANGTAYLAKEQDLPPNTVNIPNPSKPEETHTVKRKCVTAASKTLGVFKAADLSQTGEYQHLIRKTTRFAKALVSCPLNHVHSWLAYNTVYIPSVTYSTPTTALDEQKWDKIQKLLKPILLQKLGLPTTLPNGIVYGNQYFGGIGLLQLFAEQGIGQTLLFMRHIRAQTTIGNQIIIALRHYQLATGLTDSVLEDTREIPYVKIPWFDEFRHYLRNTAGTIQLSDHWSPELQRDKDESIMAIILNSGQFKTRELEIINACRLYLRVTRVSDITTSDGSRITARMLMGTYTPTEIDDVRPTKIEWPYQEKPDKSAWKIWIKALQTTICRENGQLFQSLGKWNAKIEYDWKYYLTSKDNYLYSRQDGSWCRHKPIRLGLVLKFNKDHSPSPPPINPYPVNPSLNQTNIVCHHAYSSRTPPPSAKPKANTFPEHLAIHMEPWETHLLSDIVEYDDSNFSLADHVRLGDELILGTDGGDTDGNGTFGWALAIHNRILVENLGLSPGNQEQNESLRSESTGWLSLLRFIYHYQNYHQISFENCKKIHYCDNSSLVSRSPSSYRSAPTSPFEYLKADYDVQMQIIQTLHAIGTEIPTIHVKGHQDDSKSPSILTYQAKLNIRADTLATQAYQKYYRHQPHVHYPASKCTLYINKLAVNRSYRAYLRRAYASHDTRAYLTDKFKWSRAQCENIDWYSHGTSIKSLTPNQLRFVQRFIIDWLPVNNRLHIRGRAPTNLCGICNRDIETDRHFLYCTENTHSLAQLNEALRQVFNKHKVDPHLRKIIYQGLAFSIAEELTGTPQPGQLHDIPPFYKTLVQAQDHLGWQQLWHGRFPTEWDWYQRKYTKDISEYDNDPTGEPKWIRATILTIWNHCYMRWIERCDTQHSQTNNNFKQEQLLQQITALYATRERILQRDQYIFSTTLEEWTEKSAHQMEEWIKKHKPVIKQCLINANKQLEIHAKDIRTFYPSTKNIEVTTHKEKRRCKRKHPQPRQLLQQQKVTNHLVQARIARQEPPAPRPLYSVPSTNHIRNPKTTLPLSAYFPPKDQRPNHRKLSARERVINPSSAGKSNDS